MDITLDGRLGDPLLDVMNFLNEVAIRYPAAISFAPGRPSERHFDVERSLGRAPLWVESRARATGQAPREVWNGLGQYNRTNGIINSLISRQLAADEGIDAVPESIVVTTGCQEGMAILLLGLIDPAADALLISDPCYIGIPGLARIMGLTLVPMPTGERGLEPEAVLAGIETARRLGRRPRALYDVPDFNNPLGTRMPVEIRRSLLELAHERELLIWEDNPYGMFAYDGSPLPTLKALDEHGVVIYMGSFSKTLFPGLRLGYLVADQRVVLPSGERMPLAVELSKIKSLTTVNTSTVVQAIAGGILIETGGSLRPLMAEKLPFYRANRDRMLKCLEECFRGAQGVRWNRPEGGFFLTLELPFEFTDECLVACARDYGVVVCPMSFFSLTPGRERQVRLAFSYVTGEQIADGVARFAGFVRDRVSAAGEPEPTLSASRL
ncbi:MAG TPA: PLP-dependent aminotransferase family protein [Thermoanaerobaculia bacterium]|jgi:(S)-3,5-dihydroxyphenylglycine transaminase|nr:PLP-dependent aminotransferase family protein [Thermoanaerobaculia bacterium]